MNFSDLKLRERQVLAAAASERIRVQDDGRPMMRERRFFTNQPGQGTTGDFPVQCGKQVTVLVGMGLLWHDESARLYRPTDAGVALLATREEP